MTKWDRRTIAGLVAGTAVWWAGGCGNGPPRVDSSNTEATVTGTVKVSGAPATQGEVVFNPANYARKDAQAVTAPIGADGKYTLKTLTGENEVRLVGAITKKNPILMQQRKAVQVSSGSNTIDLEFGSSK